MAASTLAVEILVFVLVLLGGLLTGAVLNQWDSLLYMPFITAQKPIDFVRRVCPLIIVWVACATLRLLFFWQPDVFSSSSWSLKSMAALLYCGVNSLEQAMILLFVRNLVKYLLLCSNQHELANSGIFTWKAPVIITSMVFVALPIAAFFTLETWTEEIVSLVFLLEMGCFVAFLLYALHCVEKQLRLGHSVLAKRAADLRQVVPSSTGETGADQIESMQRGISSELRFLGRTRVLWVLPYLVFAGATFVNTQIFRGITMQYCFHVPFVHLLVRYCMNYMAITGSVFVVRRILRREFVRNAKQQAGPPSPPPPPEVRRDRVMQAPVPRSTPAAMLKPTEEGSAEKAPSKKKSAGTQAKQSSKMKDTSSSERKASKKRDTSSSEKERKETMPSIPNQEQIPSNVIPVTPRVIEQLTPRALSALPVNGHVTGLPITLAGGPLDCRVDGPPALSSLPMDGRVAESTSSGQVRLLIAYYGTTPLTEWRSLHPNGMELEESVIIN
eukprot:g69285.t1